MTLRQKQFGNSWGQMGRDEKDGGVIFLGVLLERESGKTGVWGTYIEEESIFKSIVQKMIVILKLISIVIGYLWLQHSLKWDIICQRFNNTGNCQKFFISNWNGSVGHNFIYVGLGEGNMGRMSGVKFDSGCHSYI